MSGTKGLKKIVLIIGFIAVAGTAALLFACDAFFLPELPRTNPYDSEAVVAMVNDLTATITAEGTIQITWALPAEKPPATITIVRNGTQKPASVDDGSVTELIDPASGSWIDSNVEVGSTYFYGIWSVSTDNVPVGPKYLEITIPATITALNASVISGTSIELTWGYPQDGNIDSLIITRNTTAFPADPDDGTRTNILDPSTGSWIDSAAVSNTEYYYSVWSVDPNGYMAGPVQVQEKIAQQNVTLNPSLDGTINSSTSNYTGSPTMVVDGGLGGSTDIILLKFDTAGMPPNQAAVISASLSFNIESFFGSGTVPEGEVYKIAQAWDSSVTWTTVTTAGFDLSTGEMYTPNTTGIKTCDVTASTKDYIAGTVFGFSLKNTTSTMTIGSNVYTSESGNGPTLDITYWGDTY